MLKKHIIQHYLKSDDIISIMPQHHGKALGLMLKYLGVACVLWIIYSVTVSLMSYQDIIRWITLIGLLVILILFNYRFMMLYLDSIIITDQSIVIMDQVGLLDFSQTRFDWNSIQTISYHQHGIIDWILNKGDIIIGIEHGTNYTLPNIVDPVRRVDRLNYHKHESIVHYARDIAIAQEDNVHVGQYDKFELLVDKLSDVIIDYMGQPRHTSEVIDGDELDVKDDYPELYDK